MNCVFKQGFVCIRNIDSTKEWEETHQKKLKCGVEKLMWAKMEKKSSKKSKWKQIHLYYSV